MVHQAELENAKCSSDEKEEDKSLYMVHQAEFENAKCSSDEEEDDEILYLAGLCSKYERESVIKFDIQKDATNKNIQPPKDDALTNCDTNQNLIWKQQMKICLIPITIKHFSSGLHWNKALQ